MSNCPPALLYHRLVGEIRYSSELIERYGFGNGALEGKVITINNDGPITGTPTSGFYRVDYLYVGPPPEPPVVWQPFGSSSYTRYTLVRALTDKATDALYRPRSSSTDPGVLMFRNVDVSGKDYVADASPLGEVFFATTDLSTVIHEPRPSGMPKVVIPPQIIKLLAVVWL